jgi:hypothetical protein
MSGENVLYQVEQQLPQHLPQPPRKRLITSWAVSLGVATLVAMVKRLPGVWRCILDAGVVVGLSYGSLSILYLFFQAWRTGQAPKVDACLPTDNNNNNNNKKPSSSKTA